MDIIKSNNLEDDFDGPPPYSSKGRILVDVFEKFPGSPYKWDYEVIDYDFESSIFWITEGTGFDYWLDEYMEFPAPGRYLINNIHGEYIKGEWGYEDDDEEWEADEPILTLQNSLL